MKRPDDSNLLEKEEGSLQSIDLNFKQIQQTNQILANIETKLNSYFNQQSDQSSTNDQSPKNHSIESFKRHVEQLDIRGENNERNFYKDIDDNYSNFDKLSQVGMKKNSNSSNQLYRNQKIGNFQQNLKKLGFNESPKMESTNQLNQYFSPQKEMINDRAQQENFDLNYLLLDQKPKSTQKKEESQTPVAPGKFFNTRQPNTSQDQHNFISNQFEQQQQQQIQQLEIQNRNQYNHSNAQLNHNNNNNNYSNGDELDNIESFLVKNPQVGFRKQEYNNFNSTNPSLGNGGVGGGVNLLTSPMSLNYTQSTNHIRNSSLVNNSNPNKIEQSNFKLNSERKNQTSSKAAARNNFLLSANKEEIQNEIAQLRARLSNLQNNNQEKDQEIKHSQIKIQNLMEHMKDMGKISIVEEGKSRKTTVSQPDQNPAFLLRNEFREPRNGPFSAVQSNNSHSEILNTQNQDFNHNSNFQNISGITGYNNNVNYNNSDQYVGKVPAFMSDLQVAAIENSISSGVSKGRSKISLNLNINSNQSLGTTMQSQSTSNLNSKFQGTLTNEDGRGSQSSSGDPLISQLSQMEQFYDNKVNIYVERNAYLEAENKKLNDLKAKLLMEIQKLMDEKKFDREKFGLELENQMQEKEDEMNRKFEDALLDLRNKNRVTANQKTQFIENLTNQIQELKKEKFDNKHEIENLQSKLQSALNSIKSLENAREFRDQIISQGKSRTSHHTSAPDQERQNNGTYELLQAYQNDLNEQQILLQESTEKFQKEILKLKQDLLEQKSQNELLTEQIVQERLDRENKQKLNLYQTMNKSNNNTINSNNNVNTMNSINHNNNNNSNYLIEKHMHLEERQKSNFYNQSLDSAQNNFTSVKTFPELSNNSSSNQQYLNIINNSLGNGGNSTISNSYALKPPQIRGNFGNPELNSIDDVYRYAKVLQENYSDLSNKHLKQIKKNQDLEKNLNELLALKSTQNSSELSQNLRMRVQSDEDAFDNAQEYPAQQENIMQHPENLGSSPETLPVHENQNKKKSSDINRHSQKSLTRKSNEKSTQNHSLQPNRQMSSQIPKSKQPKQNI